MLHDPEALFLSSLAFRGLLGSAGAGGAPLGWGRWRQGRPHGPLIRQGMRRPRREPRLFDDEPLRTYVEHLGRSPTAPGALRVRK